MMTEEISARRFHFFTGKAGEGVQRRDDMRNWKPATIPRGAEQSIVFFQLRIGLYTGMLARLAQRLDTFVSSWVLSKNSAMIRARYEDVSSASVHFHDRRIGRKIGPFRNRTARFSST